MAKKEDLHKSLMLWVTEEMKFHTTTHSSRNSVHLPSENDFKLLLQKPLDDVWKYVLKHVRSVQTVKEIKGNVALKQALEKSQTHKTQHKSDVLDEKKEQLQQEKAQLTSELNSCLSDMSNLHKEMQQVTKEVMETELAYQRVCQRVRDTQRRQSLLEVTYRLAEEKIAIYSEYTRRINERTASLLHTSDNTEGKDLTVRIKNGDIETECCRDVRLTCETIAEFLNRTLTDSLTDKVALEKAQKELWGKVDKTVSSRSMSTVIAALTSNTEQAAKRLREETLELNIAKDAEQLNFFYGRKEGLQDLSSPPSVLKSVQQLLEASNLEHVMRWFKEQEHKNEEWKLTARLEDMMTDIHKHVHRVMGEHPRNVLLAKGYIEAFIQLAIEQSVPTALRTEADGLVDKIQKAKAERQDLRLKHEKIQGFKKVAEKKQSLIGCLATQNAVAPDRLDSQRKQVLNYITSRSMNNHTLQVRHLTDDLRGSLAAELDKFSDISLPCLLTVPMDSNTYLCVLDLSIAPSIHALAHERLQTYTGVCSALGFPEFKSPDSLLMHLLDVHSKVEELNLNQLQREHSVTVAKNIANTTDDISSFIKLCKRAEDSNRAQCDKLLPVLKKRIDGVTAHIAEAANVKKQVAIWWEQPAQFTTPWVVTEEMTFDQWMQKWRVAVTQVHKRMIEGKIPQKK